MTNKIAKKEDELITEVINLLKEHPIVKQMFDSYNIKLERITDIPIHFKDLNVSAKAKNCQIYLNNKLLEDGNFIDDIHYLVHELTHFLQQITGNVSDKGEIQSLDYLDLPEEIEAFGWQIAFIDAYKGKEEAEKYLEKLLDFHEFEGKKREEKRKQLMGE